MADVFISYSRKDREFVRRLHAALTDQGRDAYVDVEDIPAASPWRQEIIAFRKRRITSLSETKQ